LRLGDVMNCICNLSDCTGCGACSTVCPQNCISMKSDEEGFLYPQICNDQCIQCEKCKAVCPIINSLHATGDTNDAYAVNSKNELERTDSSSGGVFTLIAKYILSKNGVIFGAAFNGHFGVEHICIDNVEDISRIQGSKYVQSFIGDNYKKAKKYLDDGRMVFFTGTPCQVGGLLSYLGKKYDNLICQDIVCHGCPSPLVWEKYVEYLENKGKSKIVNFSFRNKKYGWKNFSVDVDYENGNKSTCPHKKDYFMRAFLKNLCLRPSCYTCSFKPLKRISDITLADYWGVSHAHAELDDDRGTSLVLINSAKGRKVFEAIREQTVYQMTSIEHAIKYNPAMVASVKRPDLRCDFMMNLKNIGFDYVRKKYLRIDAHERLTDIKKQFYIFFHKFIH